MVVLWLFSLAQEYLQLSLRIACAEAFVAGSWAWVHYDRASVMLACTRVLQVILRIAGAEAFVAGSWAWVQDGRA